MVVRNWPGPRTSSYNGIGQCRNVEGDTHEYSSGRHEPRTHSECRERSLKVPLDHARGSGKHMPGVVGGGLHGVFRSLYVARMDWNSHRGGGIDGNIVLVAGGCAGRDSDSGKTSSMDMGVEPNAQTSPI
jgi:hypothetical protein